MLNVIIIIIIIIIIIWGGGAFAAFLHFHHVKLTTLMIWRTTFHAMVLLPHDAIFGSASV